MNSKYVLIDPNVKIRWTKTPQKEIIQAVHSVAEKTFSLNRKTLNLLNLCDGTKTYEEIIAEFKRNNPQTKSESILKAVETLFEKGLVVERESSRQSFSRLSCAELEYPVGVVTMEITNRCNLRCLHCYNDSGPHRNHLSTTEIECIVDKLDRMNVGRISLSGGEPLLHPHFLDIATTIRDRGIPWSIFSNAVLIDEKMAKTLVDHGIKKVTTSLDGSTAESHDFLRGVHGSFQKTVNAVKILRAYDVPLEVHCALHRNNLREMPAILRLLHLLGVDKYAVAPVRHLRPHKENDNNKNKAGNENKYNEFTITMDDFINTLPEVVKAEYEIFGKSTFVPDPDPDCKNCGGGTSRFMIYSDGKMVPCPQSDPEFFTFGNALTDNIAEAWNNAEILKRMRSFDFKSTKECSICEYQLYCNGGCPVAKYELYRNGFVLDPYTCKTIKVLQPYLDIPEKHY